MGDLGQGDELVNSDSEKPEVLSPVFLSAVLKMARDHQISINITWKMLRPPQALTSNGVAHEVIAAIGRMRVGAAPG